MKTAFSIWDNRIAPVFDTARQVLVLDIQRGRIAGEMKEAIPDELPFQKALKLMELDVGVLVCGAVSRSVMDVITSYGIHVIPFVTGILPDIVSAYLDGRLGHDMYAMPGCHTIRRRNMGRTRGLKEAFMAQGNGMGKGQGSGAGKGTGQGTARGGRMGGGRGAGPSGVCVCMACGHEVPHERGVPCSSNACPSCGGVMTRRD